MNNDYSFDHNQTCQEWLKFPTRVAKGLLCMHEKIKTKQQMQSEANKKIAKKEVTIPHLKI